MARAEPDAIIHQMTALGGQPDLKHFDRWFALTIELRTTGTEHLLAAAVAAGVGRLIAQSFTGWTNIRGACGRRSVCGGGASSRRFLERATGEALIGRCVTSAAVTRLRL